MTIIEKSPETLAKEDLIRQTLDVKRVIELERQDAFEQAAIRLEKFNTNSLYHKVLVKGAKLIREMKRGT